jgi:hypothetical protein
MKVLFVRAIDVPQPVLNCGLAVDEESKTGKLEVILLRDFVRLLTCSE